MSKHGENERYSHKESASSSSACLDFLEARQGVLSGFSKAQQEHLDFCSKCQLLEARIRDEMWHPTDAELFNFACRAALRTTQVNHRPDHLRAARALWSLQDVGDENERSHALAQLAPSLHALCDRGLISDALDLAIELKDECARGGAIVALTPSLTALRDNNLNILAVHTADTLSDSQERGRVWAAFRAAAEADPELRVAAHLEGDGCAACQIQLQHLAAQSVDQAGTSWLDSLIAHLGRAKEEVVTWLQRASFGRFALMPRVASGTERRALKHVKKILLEDLEIDIYSVGKNYHLSCKSQGRDPFSVVHVIIMPKNLGKKSLDPIDAVVLLKPQWGSSVVGACVIPRDIESGDFLAQNSYTPEYFTEWQVPFLKSAVQHDLAINGKDAENAWNTWAAKFVPALQSRNEDVAKNLRDCLMEEGITCPDTRAE